jgi:hypothetical protein
MATESGALYQIAMPGAGPCLLGAPIAPHLRQQMIAIHAARRGVSGETRVLHHLRADSNWRQDAWAYG